MDFKKITSGFQTVLLSAAVKLNFQNQSQKYFIGPWGEIVAPIQERLEYKKVYIKHREVKNIEIKIEIWYRDKTLRNKNKILEICIAYYI